MQPKINDRKKHFALCLKKLLTYLSVRKHFYSNLFRNVKNFVPYSKACKLEILTSSVHLKNNLKTYMCFSEKYHTFLFNICDGLRTIWYHLCNFKIVKIIHGGVFLQSATLLKVIFLHGCFSRFLNWTGGTKSCKASHLIFFNKISEDTNKISSNFLNLREILREKPFLKWIQKSIYTPLVPYETTIMLKLNPRARIVEVRQKMSAEWRWQIIFYIYEPHLRPEVSHLCNTAVVDISVDISLQLQPMTLLGKDSTM